jgi:hypothetical protein
MRDFNENNIWYITGLTGQMYTDTVCLDSTISNTCAEGFGFFGIRKANNYWLWGDGLISFAPLAAEGVGPSFTKALYD